MHTEDCELGDNWKDCPDCVEQWNSTALHKDQIPAFDNICPCTLQEVKPCKDQCTCRNPLLSGGCDRCSTYGSEEQRLEQAKRLANS